jgi:hypothetical protein
MKKAKKKKNIRNESNLLSTLESTLMGKKVDIQRPLTLWP